MKALDTNVLVRFLVNDNEQQAKRAYSLFKQAEINKEELFVPILTILELIWVLDSVYDLERQDILDALHELLLLPILCFEKQSTIRNLVNTAPETNLELSDLLIANSAAASNCTSTITFDKKASRYELFELLD